MEKKFVNSAMFPAETSIAISAVSIFGINHVEVGCFNEPVFIRDVSKEELDIFCELINIKPLNVIFRN